jgi:hypothetical protein
MTLSLVRPLAVQHLAARQALPVILMAAVIQGWVLYGLHHAVKAHHWPATDQAWLIGLYALAVFIPLTVQLLAEHARTVALWRLVTVLAAAYFYFGWHHGSSVSFADAEQFTRAPMYFSIALLLIILWLMALPFAQPRISLLSDFAGTIIAELAKGNVSVSAPKWKELSIGRHVFRVTEGAQADTP